MDMKELADACDFVGMTNEQFSVLRADAQRFAGLRLILCEQDEDARTRILDAMDRFMNESHTKETTVTPELVNTLFDKALTIADNARRGES